MIKKWYLTIPELTGDIQRRAYVYVPDEFKKHPDRRYPVLYMFDGHNVFYDRDATYGKSWGMREYLRKTRTPLIIAAVECNHSPDHGRLREYSPFTYSDPDFGHIRGQGRTTMNWMVNTFKPFIDQNFPTIPDRKHTFIGGSSSLNMMFDVISRAYTHGLLHSPQPWCKEEVVKFLCPSPGYDRHFRVTEMFGAQLITVPMTADGPDMDVVEELVKDPAVKGIWCVPKYSNPEGIIYSAETVKRFANLKPAAPDFAIMWDNAYCIHEFEGDYVPFPDLISLCEEAGNPDMVYEFASTSKITFAGAGFSVMATSEANIAYFSKLFGVQMISPDKINQLRHVLYLKDKANTIQIMKRHAAVMAPKFAVVADWLENEIKPCGFADWNRPKGGYFVSLNTMHGTAKRALELCKEAGVVMTSAGATYPYGIDPNDSNIRIAPSLPPVEELEKAMEVLCICLKIAALEKLMA